MIFEEEFPKIFFILKPVHRTKSLQSPEKFRKTLESKSKTFLVLKSEKKFLENLLYPTVLKALKLDSLKLTVLEVAKGQTMSNCGKKNESYKLH